MIKRVDVGRGHYYVDTESALRIPGVTTIVGNGVPKPALTNWAAMVTAEYAIDHWAELAAMDPSVRLKSLSSARWQTTDKAKARGTLVHRLAAKLVAGEQVAIPEGIDGYVSSYVKFLDEWDVQPILVERTVHSATHNYCGTLDLVANLRDEEDPHARCYWLLDIKTARSGIFAETALQLAAYRYADVVIDEEHGSEFTMPDVTHTGAVWVRPDGYELVPVVAEAEQFDQFLYVQQVAQFLEGARELIGESLYAPSTSAWRLVQEAAA